MHSDADYCQATQCIQYVHGVHNPGDSKDAVIQCCHGHHVSNQGALYDISAVRPWRLIGSLQPAVFVLGVSKTLVVVPFPPEQLLVVEYTVELPVQRGIAVHAELLLTVFTAETVLVKYEFISDHFLHRIDWLQTG